jgi:hypothetical protein
MVPLILKFKGNIVNKFLSVVMVLCFMTFATPVLAQQTPANTVCNEKSGLGWELGLELDIDHYNVYVANSPNIAIANPPVNILVTIPHDPANAMIDADGNKVVEYNLDVTMSEGDKYFVITVSDKSGNMSGYSNEAGCEYNTIPGVSSIRLLFTLPKP